MPQITRLDSEQCDRLQQSMSLCHEALDQLGRAVDSFPVVGDAELHVMRLDLVKLKTQLTRLRDNGVELLQEGR